MGDGSIADLFADKLAAEGSLTDLMKSVEPAGDGLTSLSDLAALMEANAALAQRTQQFEFIRENYRFIDPEADCDTVDASEGKTPALTAVIDNMGPRFQVITERAAERGLLVCEMKNSNVGFRGFYSHEGEVIGVNTGSGTPERTAAEEFVHAYQDHPRIDFNEYTLPDFNLWKLGVEAQAKLSVAVEAVRQKYVEDDDTLLRQHRDQHFAVAHFLDEKVAELGIEALDDHQVLYEAFVTLMGDSKFTASNLARSIPDGPGMDKSVGTAQIDINEFVRHFGTIVGGDARSNFLEDRLTSKDQLIESLPSGSRMAIQLQIQALPDAAVGGGGVEHAPHVD